MRFKKVEFKRYLRDFNFWLSSQVNYPLVSPDAIQVTLTAHCNLKCRMCSIPSAEPAGGQELSKETIFSIIADAAAMKIKEAVLTGGEPFLRSDLFEIFDYCRQKGVRSVVTTNGTLINQELAAAAITSGLNHLHFSLDGLEQTNDFVRGKGNFAKTIQAIRIINELRVQLKSQMSIGIACTVMEHNLEDLPGLLSYADQLHVDVINFQPLLENNANTPLRGDTVFWVKPPRLPVLEEAIKKIKNYSAKHIKIYEEPELGLLGKYYRGSFLPGDWKCFGGYKTIFICVGEKKAPLVYTCHGICGSLLEKSLKSCWVSAEAQRLRRNAKNCRHPCLQACYSRVSSTSLLKILKRFFQTIYA